MLFPYPPTPQIQGASGKRGKKNPPRSLEGSPPPPGFHSSLGDLPRGFYGVFKTSFPFSRFLFSRWGRTLLLDVDFVGMGLEGRLCPAGPGKLGTGSAAGRREGSAGGGSGNVPLRDSRLSEGWLSRGMNAALLSRTRGIPGSGECSGIRDREFLEFWGMQRDQGQGIPAWFLGKGEVWDEAAPGCSRAAPSQETGMVFRDQSRGFWGNPGPGWVAGAVPVGIAPFQGLGCRGPLEPLRLDFLPLNPPWIQEFAPSLQSNARQIPFSWKFLLLVLLFPAQSHQTPHPEIQRWNFGLVVVDGICFDPEKAEFSPRIGKTSGICSFLDVFPPFS